MSYRFIQIETKEKVACLTITRESALNALNIEVLSEIRAAFEAIVTQDVGAVIITGAGRSFVAGADIAEMRDLPGKDGRRYTAVGQDLMDSIENYRLPVIAAINGFALGGGCELAMACDIRIASTKAKFGQPEVGLGITPGYGGTQRLPRLVGKGMAKYLILTGEIIDAEEAYRIGLVQKIVAPEALMGEARRITSLILSKAPIAVDVAKCAINVAEDTDLRSGIAFEREAYHTSFNSQDRVEGMSAFVEKRLAAFKNT
jgi:enoyl-CoA hydratase